ncbi:MAG: N-6 DNA methylase [Sulfurimonas sp.]|nr:N-6 DNA methylase [Sulfurimonas sp.]
MFQKSVLNSIKQDEGLIALRWAEYQKYLDKIDFIKTVKEEKYQGGFLHDIFEKCLGYTLDSSNPSDFNLEREKKNETDGKKADAVITVDDKIVGIIELKAQDTKNLDKVEAQAFNYHNSHTNSKYIIISNFDELRFYINKKTEHESFSLFNLDYDEFKKLHLLLSYESIKEDIPLHVKEKTASFEQEISKQLYKDFSAFRTHIFENLVKNNTLDKAILLRLTQKICDRIIFILFAEDRGLLTPNTINEIRIRHQNDGFGDRSMYDYYKLYFDAINAGNERLNIPKYNGGLFAKDELLDSLVLDDDILDMEAQALSNYDFMSEVGVNILGHIFEQSLTDLEELNATINDTEFDAKKSKRKKDGVFYTPEYITKYIVDNTLGKLCSDKRQELKLEDVKAPKKLKKLTQKEQTTKDNLELYKNWILNLKILDPACGSGAFLNQALDFLIKEHKALQNDLALMGDLFASYEVEKSVLENNLYGVDINEDAVEIAKLSLWLRTASKGRELTKLADKILCANSLLEMPFKEGSFDVVIGNPPYVRVQGLKSNYEDEAKLYEEKYKSATGKYDIYALFLEMSFNMLNKSGKLSYILPHKFLISDFGTGLRGFLAKNRAVESLLHFGSEMVFKDASAYTCIITLSQNNDNLYFKSLKPSEIFNNIDYDFISSKSLNSSKWDLSNRDVLKVIKKLQKQPFVIKDVFSNISQGIVSMGDDIYVLRGKFKDNYFIGYSQELNCEVKLEKEIMKPFLKGEDVKSYCSLETDLYIIYPHYKDDKNKTKPLEEEKFKDNFLLTYMYLEQFKELLIERKIKYKTNPKYWYALHRSREIGMFENEKIITPEISFGTNMTYDTNSFYHGTKCYTFIKDETFKEDYKFYLTLLNSSLMWFYLKNTGYELRGGFFAFKTKFLEPFPLAKLKNLEQQEPFIQKAELMLELHKNLHVTKQNFINEFELEKIPKKLQNFEELEFDEFVKEYKRAKKLKFADKLEERNFKNDWKALFENDAKIALDLKLQINIADKEIDKMVYELYGLSDDEVKIVEGI